MTASRLLSILPVPAFLIAAAPAAPVELVDQKPVAIERIADDLILVDFGRVAFGNLRLDPPADAEGSITVHFGEKSKQNGRIDREPPGTIRYAVAEATLDGTAPLVVAPPPDERNTKQPEAVLTPADWGVVLPFRWVEIEGWPGEPTADQITRQAGFSATWDDDAANFECPDDLLNRIWDLCKYSIKATTFAEVYIDGDRERIPYEADAYLNQLSHYYTEGDPQMARDTFDRLMEHPTWPTEWAPHMVFVAHADWMHTGGTEWLAPRYESLKSKLLLERVGDSGLVESNEQQQGWNDIVDWPEGERDGFVHTRINTVVNAFHLEAVRRMAELAEALGHDADAKRYRGRYDTARELFHEHLFMEDRGVYRDGVGTDHASLHASLFPLAFDLVPEEHVDSVVGHLTEKGMACSVYAAQYLLDGLFRHGADEAALDLITADGDRSWKHMVESGTTITWEAWDLKYKPNQDWNHAWGAAPANLLPRFVLGAEPAAAGWETATIAPRPGDLREAKGTVPTPKGSIEIHWKRTGRAFGLQLELPEGVTARVRLPDSRGAGEVLVDDQPVAAVREGDALVLKEPVSGRVKIIAR